MYKIEADRKKIFTTYGLNEIIDKEEKVIIYGAGEYGKRIADYLISVGKKNKITAFWVTQKSDEDYKGIKIVESGYGHLAESHTLIIIAVSQVYMAEIVEIIQKYRMRYCCATSILINEISGRSGADLTLHRIGTFEGLNFLLAGFIKCGTTSLYQALTQIEDIYLSDFNKESLFFSWCDKVKNPKEQLVRDYFSNIREGQIVGAIEPSFATYAQYVRSFFGKHIKILFLVRNPVDALFSRFKMDSRTRGGTAIKESYQKFGGVYTKEVFEEYYKRGSAAAMFRYTDYIQQFLECWPSDQIKIVLFEEMVKKPRKTMNEILQFIGSSCEYMYEDLPRINEGNYLMADIKGLEIAIKRGELKYEYYFLKAPSERSNKETLDELAEIEKQFEHAEKIYDLKLSGEDRKALESYYNDSVRELEKIINRDLSEIWF